jgi:hypothetical protein
MKGGMKVKNKKISDISIFERWERKEDEFLKKHPKFPLYFSITVLIIVLIKEFLF